MPVKDAAPTVLPAINSILKQTLHDFELIIIDDHSSDQTTSIIKSVQEVRIKLVYNAGKGIADAINTGIGLATGKFIARMDADDISYPTRLELQLQFARKNPKVDVISCLVEYKNLHHINQEGYIHHVNWLNSLVTPAEHYINRFTDATVAHPTVFFSAELIDKFGYYSTNNIPEDFELWLRWMEQGVTFAKVQESLMVWTDSPNRLSRTHANYSSKKFYEVKARYFTRWYRKNKVKTEIWIWGYGHKVFQKAEFFSTTGIKIKGYIDVIDRPHASRMVVSINNLEPQAHQLYLVLIGDREGKKKIAEFFQNRNLILGEDYFFMS